MSAAGFLLDTSVISEWVKARPAQNVVTWLATIDEDRVFLSVASCGGIHRGIELLPAGRRRDRLTSSWPTSDLTARFDGRILGIDRQVAEAWGQLMARAQRGGIALGTMDAFFAATAEVHGLTLVTRNTRDFEALAIALFDPWSVAPNEGSSAGGTPDP